MLSWEDLRSILLSDKANVRCMYFITHACKKYNIYFMAYMEKPKISLKIIIHIRLLLAVTSEDRAELVGDNFVKRKIMIDLYF